MRGHTTTVHPYKPISAWINSLGAVSDPEAI
jgi:hypothetical protein